MLGKAARGRALDWLEQAPARHRARADAEQMLLALAHAAGVEVGPVQNLDQRLPVLAALATSEKVAPRRDATT